MRYLCCVVGLLIVASVAHAEPLDLPETVQFNRDIRPILSGTCFHCHGPDSKAREGKLRFDIEENVFAARDDGPAVTRGSLDKSGLWKRINSTDEDEQMPPPDSGKKLTAREKALFKKWIEQGAKWQGHWSFITPTLPKPPAVKNTKWSRNAIDAFVLARLEKKGLAPNAEADKATLIRRVTFDLTGLPPTPAEVKAFENDKSPDAYGKVVDRLLLSPHYGERMTLSWMDAARYGDSSVFHADGPRDMWGWRDWVINAYNSNMPFSQFTVEQIAGDLIPNATPLQKTASGFNRNHGTTDEGGVIAEEYRVEYVVDRVKTTSTVWLGMTLECAQCHKHKFDPFSQKEYYQLYAFFNNSTDKGMQTRGGNAAPKISIPRMLFGSAKAKELKAQLAKLKGQQAKHLTSIGPAFEKWVAAQAAKPKGGPKAPSDMLAHWPLDAAKGAAVVDAVDPKRKGSIKGAVSREPGKVGGALKLDGKNFVELGNIGDFDNNKGFSYGAWVKTAGNANGAVIAKMNDKNKFRGYDLWLQGGKPGAHIVNAYPNNCIKVVANKALKPGQWHHVFITYDGSNKAAGVKIYIDGKHEAHTIEQNNLGATIKTPVPLKLGRRHTTSPIACSLDDVRLYSRALSMAEVGALAGQDHLGPILAIATAKRTKQQIETLRSHYLATSDPTYKKLGAEIAKVNASINSMAGGGKTSVMIMQDNGKVRPTYLLMRGHYASPKKDEVIKPGTPAFLPPMATEAPRNRLGLAQWMTDPKHPLTARVAVNRYWQMMFGIGLVDTPEDFGAQGAWPTHPGLLDWLAVDFTSNGWNVKRTLKQIVTSATYRQSARLTPKNKKADPNNRLLTRGSRFRLQGEFVRDNALAISGLLVRTIGGPSVKPYQPAGLWNEVALSGNVRFRQDKGAKLYRRSMYTYWKRSAPAPALRIFDTPTREKCVIRRQRTNTPLQALVTLNDPQFVEASRVLAQRMMFEGGKTPEERIRFAYRLATARVPNSAILKILLDGYNEELAVYKGNMEKAKQLLAVGESKRDESLDAAQHAAWTIVASILLNLDETITRG
jgi:hypothetical protein